MQQAIATWLSNPARDYEEGLRLLAEHGRNKQLHQHLSRKQTADNFQKLDYELQKISEQAPVLRELAARGMNIPEGSTIIIMPPAAGGGRVVPLPASGEPADVVALPPPVLSDEVRQRIDELAVQAGRLYIEQAALSNTIDDAPSDEARKSVVEQIEQIKQQRDTLGIERKRLEAGGPLVVAAPEQPAAPVPTMAELVQARNNLRTSVSKAKNEVAKATDPEKRQKKQERLDRLQVELEQADLQVKAMQGAANAG